jgi:hypothetical protein
VGTRYATNEQRLLDAFGERKSRHMTASLTFRSRRGMMKMTQARVRLDRVIPLQIHPTIPEAHNNLLQGGMVGQEWVEILVPPPTNGLRSGAAPLIHQRRIASVQNPLTMESTKTSISICS